VCRHVVIGHAAPAAVAVAGDVGRIGEDEIDAAAWHGPHVLGAVALKDAAGAHIVFRKRYASKSGFLRAEHEAAYLLAKGEVERPALPIPDVLEWRYTGNRLHPTQKPVEVLTPLIEAFSRPGAVVLDPFCGSGSTLIAARDAGRHYLGIELDPAHQLTATRRMAPCRDVDI